MKLNKFALLTATILFVVISLQTAKAQPPPPTGGPPCWPPPCVPVDNGIIFAICAAVLFGAYAIWRTFKTRAAE